MPSSDSLVSGLRAGNATRSRGTLNRGVSAVTDLTIVNRIGRVLTLPAPRAALNNGSTKGKRSGKTIECNGLVSFVKIQRK